MERAGFLLLLGFAFVLERHDHEQFAVALRQVEVEGLEHARRQRIVLGAAVDEPLAPLQDFLHELAHELHEIGAPFDDVGPGDGMDHRLLGETHGHADPVRLDQTPALVDHEIGDSIGLRLP